MTRDMIWDEAQGPAHEPATDAAPRPARPRPRQSAPVGRVAAVVIALSGVVAAASYVAGRNAAGDVGAPRGAPRTIETTSRDAASAPAATVAEPDADVESADGAEVASATIPERPAAAEEEDAGPRRPAIGGDVAGLQTEVADAVLEARRLRTAAEAAERRADRAAERARAGDRDGVSVERFENGDRYEGEVVDGVRRGVGVYTWANALEGTYAGEFEDGAIAGLGVKRWADGAAYYGSRSREAREGYGVFAYADGGGYEGEWKDGAPDGYGVVWSSRGEVRSQGRWESNVLVESWVAPTPVATGAETPTPIPADGD